MAPDCPREQDVLDALASARWPMRCESELREHVAGCAVCRDLADVVGALGAAQDELWPTIHVPSASTMWWRAQLRARHEAARKASTPITIAQAAAGTVILAALVGVLYVASPSLFILASMMPSLPSVDLPELGLPTLAEMNAWRWVALGAFVTWLVMAPLALYLAREE